MSLLAVVATTDVCVLYQCLFILISTSLTSTRKEQTYFAAFYINPQYRVHIDAPDEDDEDGLATIIVGLMQKDRRKARQQGGDNHAIGYGIYRVSIVLKTLHTIIIAIYRLTFVLLAIVL